MSKEVILNLPDDTYEAVLKLAEITGVNQIEGIETDTDKITEMFMDSLRTMEWLVWHQAHGGKLSSDYPIGPETYEVLTSFIAPGKEQQALEYFDEDYFK